MKRVSSLCWNHTRDSRPGAHLKHLIQVLIGWGPYGLLLLATVDSAGIPAVGGVDALLITLSAKNPAQAYAGAICAILGSLAGSLVLFGIARKGGEVLLSKHISSRRGARWHAWFQRYGLVTVFLPALSPIPLPLKVPVFCAGALQVRWPYFASVVLCARTIRYLALAYLGVRYGRETIGFLISHGRLVAAIVAGLALVLIFVFQFFDGSKVPETSSTLDNASARR